MLKTEMLRVMMTKEQFDGLRRMRRVYNQPNISEYVRMMALYFEQHRPTVVVQPQSEKMGETSHAP